MEIEITPLQFATAAGQGFDRLRRYRQANAMFVKEYYGQYYAANSGTCGKQPINMIYAMLRAVIPNLVMKDPLNKVITKYPDQRDYAELLSMALDDLAVDLKLKNEIRGWITSAYFSLGIMKTGLKASGQMINFGDVNVDPGQIYTSLVDLDDFTFDPNCKTFSKASFMGSRVVVPRQELLDIDIYDSDVVMQLPSAYENVNSKDLLSDVTRETNQTAMDAMEDYVSVVELWIPGANALVTIADPTQVQLPDFVGVTDYYGPKEGPFTFLSFTAPVQGNPLPVSPVAQMFDLHLMTNDTMVKVMEQSSRQKDLLLYSAAGSDEAEDIKDAVDGDTMCVNDPSAFNALSIGGQNPANVAMLGQMQTWANYMAGNPDQISGVSSDADSATAAQIQNNNASISMEDARGILYDATANITSKIGWYLHTDPLIDIPLTKRATGGATEYFRLTPEQRDGDFLNLKFSIVPRSMSVVDPILRQKYLLDFVTNVVPQAANTAMTMMQLGYNFNLPAFLTTIAEEQGIIEYVSEWIEDPGYEQRLMVYATLGSQSAGKAEGGTAQNGGNPNAAKKTSPAQDKRANAQQTAAVSQSATKG